MFNFTPKSQCQNTAFYQSPESQVNSSNHFKLFDVIKKYCFREQIEEQATRELKGKVKRNLILKMRFYSSLLFHIH